MTVEYGGAINKTVGEYATRITIFPWPKERRSCLVTFQKASHTDTQTDIHMYTLYTIHMNNFIYLFMCVHLYIICLSRGVMATTTTTTGCKTKIKRGACHVRVQQVKLCSLLRFLLPLDCLKNVAGALISFFCSTFCAVCCYLHIIFLF